MDMKIAGSGVITAGEYEGISVSGSARMDGVVICEKLNVAGALSGETVTCKKELRVSGKCQFSKEVKADAVRVAGTLSCGNLKCGSLTVAGMTSSRGDIEAEIVKIDGALTCEGLLNAEEITIQFENNMKIGGIGGSKIAVLQKYRTEKKQRLPLFASLVKSMSGAVQVQNAVEGDDIALEGVICERVSGKIVAIGDGCEIALVQYSDKIEISPNAKVGSVEKIGF